MGAKLESKLGSKLEPKLGPSWATMNHPIHFHVITIVPTFPQTAVMSQSPRIVSENCYVIFRVSMTVASTGCDTVGFSIFLGDKVYLYSLRRTN